MARTALEIDANTFQFFTRNPRGGKAKALNEKDISAFIDFTREHKIADFVAHAPYTLNICSDKENIRQFTVETFEDDLARLEHIPGCMYNFHPGSHVGQGLEVGIDLIASALNQLLRPEFGTIVLLETMSGKGSEIGGRFEDLHEIIDRVEHSDKLGVCLDTCHVHDAGYDIVNDLDGVLTEFDRVVGLNRLKAIHLNDSKNSIGARKDRHETIGNGYIGLEVFRRIINHPVLRELPFILETPNELPGYAEEIMLLRGMWVG